MQHEHMGDDRADVVGREPGLWGAVGAGVARVVPAATQNGNGTKVGWGLLGWLAGPSRNLPINYDFSYTDAEIRAITDGWNWFYFRRLCLARAGVSDGGRSCAGDAAEVGVSHAAC